MMKNKKELLITTLLCLLPIAAGMMLYDSLPEQIATHFGLNGEADGWSGRAFTVFGLPAFMAVMNIVVQFALSADPKKQNMNQALRTFAVWMIPAMSIIVSALVLGNALGHPMHIEVIMPLLVGLVFIVIGNYLPKTKQSYTMGIRLPWTLASEENWNRTHRLAGFTWVVGGALTILFTLLRMWSIWLFAALMILLVLVPGAYSYLLYKKGI